MNWRDIVLIGRLLDASGGGDVCIAIGVPRGYMAAAKRLKAMGVANFTVDQRLFPLSAIKSVVVSLKEPA